MRNESSPSRIPQPAKIAIAFAATLTLFACGGGGEDIGDGRSIPLKAGNAMPKPPAFVPLAVALPDDASEYDKHMQVARISWAYNDDITAPHWCANPGQGGNPNLGIRDVVPITEIFDGFYFTGTVSVGQFAMKTSDGGYILFDTMNNATDVANITVPQLQSAGIDPATLRGLVVTHGHGDHDGGAPELQARYSPPTTVVGSADYNANKRYVATIQVDSTKAGVPEQLTINGATFTAMATPGHTPGTTSFILPVTYKGQPHKIAYWGGSGLPGSASGRLQYMQGAEAMYAQIKEQQADGQGPRPHQGDPSPGRHRRQQPDDPRNGQDPTGLRHIAFVRRCPAVECGRDCAQPGVAPDANGAVRGAAERERQDDPCARARVELLQRRQQRHRHVHDGRRRLVHRHDGRRGHRELRDSDPRWRSARADVRHGRVPGDQRFGRGGAVQLRHGQRRQLLSDGVRRPRRWRPHER
jgi:glyoxylase-like metal-dependent hydrolase (beta-lactamase superfamily II)